jgi:hypothetical protein
MESVHDADARAFYVEAEKTLERGGVAHIGGREYRGPGEVERFQEAISERVSLPPVLPYEVVPDPAPMPVSKPAPVSTTRVNVGLPLSPVSVSMSSEEARRWLARPVVWGPLVLAALLAVYLYSR